MNKMAIVVRSFQAGTGEGGKPFDKEIFERQVAKPISRVLRSDAVKNVIVVINGDEGSSLAEIKSGDGMTPTLRALQDRFPDECGAGLITARVCTNWGPNPGSAIALNWGLEIVKNGADVPWVLNWSPEIEMDGDRISLALAHAERHNLSVVGFLRQSWWEKPQWKVVQNTAALWRVDLLSSVGGFSEECNGTGRTVKTEEYGDVPLAGMEDFHALLKIMRAHTDLRWGMVGRADPLFWDTDFPRGSEREINHLKKVARQYGVMQAWANSVFPELTFKKLMDRLFSACHFD
jgi:hypothetical protein